MFRDNIVGFYERTWCDGITSSSDGSEGKLVTRIIGVVHQLTPCKTQFPEDETVWEDQFEEGGNVRISASLAEHL